MMSQKKKKIFTVLLFAAAAVTPMFAQSIKNGSESLDLSFVSNAVNLIVGIFAGGYVLLKAAMDIFHAVRNSSEDPNGLKKAIGSLILNIAVLGGFLFVVNYVFGGMATKNLDLASESTTAQDAFFSALTGALVSLPF